MGIFGVSKHEKVPLLRGLQKVRCETVPHCVFHDAVMNGDFVEMASPVMKGACRTLRSSDRRGYWTLQELFVTGIFHLDEKSHCNLLM